MSRLRTGREAKSDKDVFQASVLCAALAESHPGAVESAVEKIPRRARNISSRHRIRAALHRASPPTRLGRTSAGLKN